MIVQSFRGNRIGEYPVGPNDVVVVLRSSTQGPIECKGSSYCTNGEAGVNADQITIGSPMSGRLLEAREVIKRENLPEDKIVLRILSILESGKEIAQDTPEWNALFNNTLNVVKEETKLRLIECGKAGGVCRQDLFYLGTCDAVIPDNWRSLSDWQKENEGKNSFADGLSENTELKRLQEGQT